MRPRHQVGRLYFQWRTTHPRRAHALLAATLSAGALFGWAQLARGAHFPSHTFVVGMVVLDDRRRCGALAGAESADLDVVDQSRAAEARRGQHDERVAASR